VYPVAPEAEGTALWIKRDDLTGERYGGNKVRKLEFLLAEARRRGAERLITVGAAGSHHALATTAYGTALGFRVTLVLFPQPLTPHVREVLLLDHALGAELRWAPRMELIPLALLAARAAHRRERTLVVPAGGSDEVGTLGYVSAGLELAEQVEQGAVPRPSTVHVAAGTMGTAVGLATGLAIAELPVRVVANRVASRLVANSRGMRRLLRRTLKHLEQAGADAPSAGQVLARLELRHDQLGPGYGRGTDAGARARARLAAAGLALDPTYTAKAAAGWLAEAERSLGTHLFWHTLSATLPRGPAVDPDSLPEPFRRYLRGP
jgi:1-aminocyclopropane-1-carboxylate deaminase/D-cysteine desulfhydrase-like pyridoxal-dependent ACC family enzyme